ncbi:MAG: hypothetical protein N2C14_13370 [Planctomycetales bacterium]
MVVAMISRARDFLVLPTAHSFIMSNLRAKQCALRFLEHWRFVSEEERRSLTDPLDSLALGRSKQRQAARKCFSEFPHEPELAILN